MWLTTVLIVNTLTVLTTAHADCGRPTPKDDDRFRNRMDNFQTRNSMRLRSTKSEKQILEKHIHISSHLEKFYHIKLKMKMASKVFSGVINTYTQVSTDGKSIKKAMKPIILIILLYFIQEVIETKNFYSCPKKSHRFYGAIFIFGPGACFFALALLLNGSFWTSINGCYRANVDWAKLFKKTGEALLNCVFVALVWLVIAFACTDFYVCLRLGAKPSDAPEDVKETFSKVKATSTLIAGGILFATVLFALVYTVIRRCFFKDSKQSFLSIRKYKKLELKAAVQKFQKDMEVLSKKEGEAQVDLYLKRSKEKGEQAHVVIEEAREGLETKYCERPGSYPEAYVSVELLSQEHQY